MQVLAYRYNQEPWKPLALLLKPEYAERLLEHMVAPTRLTDTSTLHTYAIVDFSNPETQCT